MSQLSAYILLHRRRGRRSGWLCSKRVSRP